MGHLGGLDTERERAMQAVKWERKTELGEAAWVQGEGLTKCKTGQSWGINMELRSRSWRRNLLRSGQQRSAGCGEGRRWGTNIVLFGNKPLGYLCVIPSSSQWCPWKTYPVAFSVWWRGSPSNITCNYCWWKMNFLHSTKALLSWYESDPINYSKLSWATASEWKVQLMREHCIQRVRGGWRRGAVPCTTGSQCHILHRGDFYLFVSFSFWDDTKEEKITPFLLQTGNQCCSCASSTHPDLPERKAPVKWGEAPSSQQMILQGKKDSSLSCLMLVHLLSSINPSVCCFVGWLEDMPRQAPCTRDSFPSWAGGSPITSE